MLEEKRKEKLKVKSGIFKALIVKQKESSQHRSTSQDIPHQTVKC